MSKKAECWVPTCKRKEFKGHMKVEKFRNPVTGRTTRVYTCSRCRDDNKGDDVNGISKLFR